MNFPQHIQKWLTLVSHWFATFSNAIGFGFYFTNTKVFANYYNISTSTIQNSFFVGLICAIIFCIPAMKIVEWRLDYSIICSAFISMAAYWINFMGQNSFIVAICSLIMLSLGQAIVLPMSNFLAERWFPLEKRSLAISMSFYMNILGFSFGATFTTVYVTTQSRVSQQGLIISILSTVFFFLALALAKNKPKILLEKYRTLSLKQIKYLWRYKFNTYSILMSSVFLGCSWTFLYNLQILTNILDDEQVAILIFVWIFSGMIFGVIISVVMSNWVSQSGSFRIYDITTKSILLTGMVGYVLLGVCVTFKATSFVLYLILMVIIGIGSIGFYGLTFLSLAETCYPISSILIGNLIVIGASIYAALASLVSILIQDISQGYDNNIFYILAIICLLPWIYITVTYSTNFKRYKYYLDQTMSQYRLIKVDDFKSIIQQEKKLQ